METEFNVSTAELVVMRVIWSLGEARVDEITCQLPPDLDWSLATVKTLLGRLVKKEILITEKEGRKFIYRPLIEECNAIQMMGYNLVNKVCQTKHEQLLADMITMSSLTAEDIDTLQAVLAKKKTVEQTKCSCLENFSVCTCQHAL